MIDNTDEYILNIIQNDSSVSNVDISRQLGMAPSATLERIRKLKEKGVIKGYHARINPKSVDMGLLAFIHIKTNTEREKWDVADIVSRIPEVLEVHDIAGEDCYLVKLRTRDTESLYELLRNKFGSIPSVESTRTTIVLRTMKETTVLPVKNNQGKNPTGKT